MRFLILLLSIATGLFLYSVEKGSVRGACVGWSSMAITIFYIIMVWQITSNTKKRGPGEPEPPR